MAEIDIDVGGSLDQIGADFVAAWKNAEDGQVVEASRHIVFQDWAALCAVMTPDRYDLIRHLKREPGTDAQAVARELGRELERVTEDIAALADLGLVVRTRDGRLTVPLDQIVSTIRFAA